MSRDLSNPHSPNVFRTRAAPVDATRGRAFGSFWSALWYLFPALLVFVTFTYYPLASVAYLSLTDADLISPPQFVGLENYRFLTTDPGFLLSLRVTAVFSLALTLLEVTLGMALGFLMNAPSRVQGLLRGAIFAPVVVSVAATAILWIYFLNPTIGPLGGLFALFGVSAPNFLMGATTALPSVILVSFWKGVGFAAVLYLAGLQGIPVELEEAAAVDGAGRWLTLRRVVIPLLAPTTSVVFFISLVNSFQAYGLVLIMTQGGPAGSTRLLGYFLYENAFRFFQMGYASAISIVLFVLLATLAFVQFRLSERRIHYQ